MTTRHAVCHGNIGLLCQLVNQLCVWFYGAKQVRYGYKMLHLCWLLSSQVATAELQQVVLASSVVNLQGRANSFKAVNLALEHVNCCYAIDMKMFKNSTHDLSKTFGQVALTSSYSAQLRAAVETAFGERTNSRHSSKSAVGNVFSLANYLWLERCTGPRLHHDQSTVQFESLDILAIGMELLKEKVNLFNDQNITASGKIPSVTLNETAEQVEGDQLGVATKYMEAIDDDFHIDPDPVFQLEPGISLT